MHIGGDGLVDALRGDELVGGVQLPGSDEFSEMVVRHFQVVLRSIHPQPLPALEQKGCRVALYAVVDAELDEISVGCSNTLEDLLDQTIFIVRGERAVPAMRDLLGMATLLAQVVIVEHVKMRRGLGELS